MSDAFTASDVRAWRAYEKVRLSGAYNMIADPRARRATGLSDERYGFVLTHYSQLKAHAGKGNK